VPARAAPNKGLQCLMAAAGLMAIMETALCFSTTFVWAYPWNVQQQRPLLSKQRFLTEIPGHQADQSISMRPTSTFGVLASALLVSGAILGAATRRSTSQVAGRLHTKQCLRASDDMKAAAGGVAVAEKPVTFGINPATAWPSGKPRLTTQYLEEYDMSDPKGSFQRVGEMLIKEMLEELPDLYEMPEKEVDWVSESLKYNTQGGKMNRGLICVQSGVELLKSQGLTPSNRDLHRFAVLGWAVELLQSCMLMADDMMDGSITRRGNPCWFRLKHVGNLAINDFLLVEMFVYKVLKRHFGEDPFFPWLVDLFLETTFQTECGQLLDSICANCKLEELTTSRWTLVVKYKTAFYSFYLPVALAMLATGVRDQKLFDKARDVLLEMGIYFQAQDDFLDAFASPEVLGKVGTDIQDKKCSWLFAHAYHDYGTDEARSLLDASYGKCEVGSFQEQSIKDLYVQLGLKERFEEYELDVTAKLQQYKNEVEAVGLPWSIFDRFFLMIKGRRK